jgi:hypothetical protein
MSTDFSKLYVPSVKSKRINDEIDQVVQRMKLLII